MSIHHNKNSEKTDPAKQRGENPKEETWGEYLERKADYYGRPVGEYDPNADISFSEDGETTEEKEIRFSLDGKPFAPMDTMNMRKPGPGEAPGREAADIQPHAVFQPEEGKADAVAAWKDQFYREGNNKYRIVATGGPKTGYGQKRVYMVGDDEAQFAAHKTDEVEMDFSAELLANLTADSLKEMWKGKFANVPDGHLPSTDELKELRRQLVADKMPGGDTAVFEKALVNGGDSGATFALLKQTGAWELYRLLDLTRQYHVYHQVAEESIYGKAEAGKRPAGKGRASLPGPKHEYEKQVSANCYGCAGAKLINYLTGENLLDQYKVRNFVPRYLSRAEHDRFVGNDAEDYEKAKQGVEVYAGEGKTRYGNFFGISDVIFDKEEYGGLGRKDIAVHKATYHLGSVDNDTKRHNLIEAMKTKLTDLIGSGAPAALLTNGHYVTVIGIDGDKITYLDSLPSQHKLGPITKDFTTFLLGDLAAFDTVELTWAKKIDENSREALRSEYGGLGIDDETGELIRTNGIHTDEDVAHRAGIAITKSREEMDAQGNADICRYLTESVCLHRGAFMTEEQFAAWEERDKQAWEEAEKEQPVRRKEPLLTGERRIEKEDHSSEGEKEKPVSGDDMIITTETEKKDENTDPDAERLSAMIDRISDYESAENTLRNRRRAALFGKDTPGDKEGRDCYRNALRCMKLFDPKVTEDELADRFAFLERNTVRKDKLPVETHELLKNAQIMENLLAQILSLDIEKEFGGKEPKEMVELYFRYEPLFSFAKEPKPLMENLKECIRNIQISTALTGVELAAIRMHLDRIDQYGKYFLNQIEKEKDVPAPDPKYRPMTEERRTEIISLVKDRWKGFDETFAPLEKFLERKTAASTRETTLCGRMEHALRGYPKEEGGKFNKGLALAAMHTVSVHRDNDAAAGMIYRDLYHGVPAGDKEKETRYVTSAEKIFHAVLTFDFAILPKEDPMAILEDAKAYEAYRIMAFAAPEILKLLKGYRGIHGENAGKALSDEQLAQIEDRCTVFAEADRVISGQLYGIWDQLRTMDPVPGADTYESEQKYASLLTQIKKAPADLSRGAMEAITAKYAEAERLRKEAAEGALSQKLNEGLSPFAPVTASGQLFDGYSETYREKAKYSQSRREKEMKTAGNALYQKDQLAKQLRTGVNVTKDRTARARRAISFNVRAHLSMPQFRAISAFFGEDVLANSLLVSRFCGKINGFGAEPPEEKQLEAKYCAYDILAEKFLSLHTEGIDLSTDAALAQNAGRLEDMTQQVCGMKVLLESDAGFVRALSDRIISAPGVQKQESLYDRIMTQMDRLGRLTDHYRARKLVMADPYYRTHYNDEIGLTTNKTGGSEKARLTRLLSKSRETALILDEAKNNASLGHWMDGGSFEAIGALEEEAKTAAYADERLDTTLITKDSLKEFLKEIKKYRKMHPKFVISYHVEQALSEAKNFSPTFAAMIKQISTVNSQKSTKEFSDLFSPSLYDRLVALGSQDPRDTRLRKLDTELVFNDPSEKVKYEYPSTMNRDQSHFAKAGAGQMMSSEEIVELVESLDAAQWKDIDYSDPVQAAAAKDMYLTGMAQTHQIFFNEQKRLLNTYGFLPMQLSPAAFIVAAGSNTHIASRMVSCNVTMDFLESTKSVTINGQSMRMLDALVLQGYLSKEYAAWARQTMDHLGSIPQQISQQYQLFDGYFQAEEDEIEGFSFDAFSDHKALEEGAKYRGAFNGPMLSDEDETKGWILSSAACAQVGIPDGGKMVQESNLIAMRKKDHYTRSMAQLERFINNLSSVDTKGHSKEYKLFYGKLGALRGCFLEIANKNSPDGKNLDPDSMLRLRAAYDEVIKASRNYLKNKNRSHKNALYRRRYDIVDELREVMENDAKVLGDKNPGASYNLGEALEECREAQFTVSKEDIEILEGTMSRRNVFSFEIGGERKKWVFTERQIAGGSLKKKRPNKENLKEIGKALTMAEYGIPIGSNVDMRNAAMSIMAKEMGTENNIAASILANVEIKEDEKKAKRKRGWGLRNNINRGTITEFIEGININDVRKGIRSGDIIVDNEAELLEQMSDIQVTDYLCGNVDRHLNNLVFEMEDTDKVNEKTGKPIRRIRRLVGIDNDLSFGNRNADTFTRHTKYMSVPETMQVISRKTALRILGLEKNRVFLMLGGTVTEEEKEAMWTRVEHMQLAIKDAMFEGKEKGLTVVDDFRSYSLQDIAGANLEQFNLFRDMCNTTHAFGRNIPANEETVPHRLNAKEVRLDLVADKTMMVETGKKKEEKVILSAMQLYHDGLPSSPAKLLKSSEKGKINTFFSLALFSAEEFDDSVGMLFDHVSSQDKESDLSSNAAPLNLFSNQYANAHGIRSIADIVFIDGVALSQKVPELRDTAAALLEDRFVFTKIVSTKLGRRDDPKDFIKPEHVDALQDMLAKAYIMAYLVSGQHQITIANYQKKHTDGTDELVITDLNPVLHAEKGKTLAEYNMLGEENDSKLIQKSRKNRRARFTKIEQQMEKRQRKSKTGTK